MDDLILLIGRTHPLLVHLPLGILLLAALGQVMVRFRRYDHLRHAISISWLAGAVTAVLACAAGYVLSLEGGYDESLLVKHQWLGVAVALVAIVAAILSRMEILHGKLSTLIVLLCVVTVSLTGHFGGSLTHGEDFLTEPFLALADDNRRNVNIAREPIADSAQAVFYNDIIEPILIEKCSECHGASKRKGGLRLDHYDYLIKGGKNGMVVLAGAPDESELIRRIMLGNDDKKKMPPKDKPQLTDREIVLIHAWIGNGRASNKIRFADAGSSGDRSRFIAGAPAAVPGAREEFLPYVSLPAPDSAALVALRQKGVIVRKLSDESELLFVNLVNVPDFPESDSRMLLSIKDHIAWLRAGNSSLNDESMKVIGQFPHLMSLNLEYTKVTDVGLKNLAEHKHLRYLNLVGTNVGEQSLTVFTSIRSLKSLYLWRTRFQSSQMKLIREQLPQAEVSFGEMAD